MQHTIERDHERGRAEEGWLRARFGFSFGEYLNRQKMGFGALRVFNDDLIEPGGHFPLHGHCDYEVITVVLEGAIEHSDTLGHRRLIPAGQVQHMSTGSGVEHSERNPLEHTLHSLQIWIRPRAKGLVPAYNFSVFGSDYLNDRLAPLVCGAHDEQALVMAQEGRVLRGRFSRKFTYTHMLDNCDHGLYLFVVQGSAKHQEFWLKPGDSAALSGIESISLELTEGCDLVAIEVPMQGDW